jgi:hypothetical protein
MNPPLRIDVGPPDFMVKFPGGSSLQLYNHADSVTVSHFRSNGEVEIHELTHEQYERFRKKLAKYNLPEFKPRSPGTGANGNTVGKVVGQSGAAAVPAPAANPPVQPQTPAEASTGTKILDGLQTGLDVAGLVPGVGEFADLGNAAISALRGDWIGAGLSLGAAVPFAGWGATGAKALRKGSQALSKEAAERAAREAAEKAEKEAAEQAAEQGAKTGKDGAKVKGKDDPPNICKLLAASIYARVPEVVKRFIDMMEDKLNLFGLTIKPDGSKGAPHPSLPKGSGTWHGHVQQLQQKQQSLRDEIIQYDANRCTQPKILKSIRDLAYYPIPQSPGGTPGYPLNQLPP